MEKDYMPLCYWFSFDIENTILFLRIQKCLIPKIKEIIHGENRLMSCMCEEYDVDKSIFANFGEKYKSFGFNNAIDWSEETENEIIYSYKLYPSIESTNEPCKKCNGTGEGVYSYNKGKPCFECRSTGKKQVKSKHSIADFILSFFPIMSILNLVLMENCYTEVSDPAWEVKTNKKQLVAVEWNYEVGMSKALISAWMDRSIFELFSEEFDGSQIIEAMWKTGNLLLKNNIDKDDFLFWGSKNSFGLQVPGNACYISTDKNCPGMFNKFGVNLFPHNIDNMFQQIEFIIGLAVINDIAEKHLNEDR